MPNQYKSPVSPFGFLIIAFLTWLPLLQALPSQPNIRSDLMPAFSNVYPGQTLPVAVRISIPADWHIYWQNPGDTGMPTSLEWRLPEGATLVRTYHDLPIRYENSGLVDYVHEGETWIISEINFPDTIQPGDKLELQLQIDWLACKEICVPGGASLSLTLPVVSPESVEASPHHQRVTTLLANHPLNQPPPTISLTRKDGLLTLSLPTQTASSASVSAFFFPEEPWIAPSAAQTVRISTDSLDIDLPIADPARALPDPISGYLRLEVDGDSAQYLRINTAHTIGAPSNSRSLLLMVGLAFVGGLILNLMPCVFPIIGIKIMGFVSQAGEDRARIASHGLLFTAGVLVSFWVLAGLLLLLRAGGQQLGWGFQLQEPLFVYALMILFLLFAFNLSGLFEFGLSLTRAGGVGSRSHPALNSFLSGGLATLVATPCSAPFLATALAAAITMPPVQSWLLFSMIGLGLAFPYLLLSLFPSWLSRMPRPGPWMETFKKIMAFPLYATAAFLLWTLIPHLDEQAQLKLFLAIPLIGAAIWVFGHWAAPYKPRKTRRIAHAVTLLIFGLAVILSYPSTKSELWSTWSKDAEQNALRAGNIVFVDFTARWCATCQINKANVFSSDEVLRTFSHYKVLALKADWTSRDPAITTELARFGRAAVPFNIIYHPGSSEPIILPELLTPGMVIDAITRENN